MARKNAMNKRIYKSVRVGGRVLKVLRHEHDIIKRYANSIGQPIGQAIIHVVSGIKSKNKKMVAIMFRSNAYGSKEVSAACGVLQASMLKEIVRW